MSDEKRKGDPGDTVREGVRSIVGILGALKDAIEQSFDDLRASGERAPERAREAARNTAQQAKEAVDDVRERFDFVARRDLEALRDEVGRLRVRLEALEQAAGITPSAEEPAAESAGAEEEPGPTDTPETPDPPEERPFRIHTE